MKFGKKWARAIRQHDNNLVHIPGKQGSIQIEGSIHWPVGFVPKLYSWWLENYCCHFYSSTLNFDLPFAQPISKCHSLLATSCNGESAKLQAHLINVPVSNLMSENAAKIIWCISLWPYSLLASNCVVVFEDICYNFLTIILRFRKSLIHKLDGDPTTAKLG